jgi:hypothetical protein
MVTGARRVVCAQMGETRVAPRREGVRGGEASRAVLSACCIGAGALGGPMPHQSHQRRAQLEVRAREMRLSPTLSEARLWQAVQGSQLGVGFRR